MAPEIEHELLENVALSRRSFVKKAVLGSAFAFPVIASFDMRSLAANDPSCLTPNQTNGEFDDFFKLKVIGATHEGHTFGLKIRISDPDTGKNVSRNGRKVRVSKIVPKPKHVGLKLPKSFEFVNDHKHGRHYELKLDVKGWPKAFYNLHILIADDPNEFNVGIWTGNCDS
jgi:hypothetical protein